MKDFYYVLSFDSTNYAIQAEARMKEHFKIAMIPTPREITLSCGLSIRIFSLELHEILGFIEELRIPCSLYKLSSEKIQGKREIERVYASEQVNL